MSESRSTLVEQRHPRLRRKNTTMIDTFLKQTFAKSFLTFVQTQNQQSQRPSLKESQEMIQFHYKMLHNIIDSVDQHLARRLQNHEKQIFTIVKEQIGKMRSEMEEVVQKLNAAIKQKNIEDEIWQLSNELDYFKSQTYQLFQQNKMLRQDMNKLKKQMKENEIELENSSKTMQKLKYACMKAKVHRDSTSQNKNKKVRQSVQKSNKSLSNNKHFKTEVSQLNSNNRNVEEMDIGVQLPKQSIVNIKTSIKSGKGRSNTMNIDGLDPLSHDFSSQSSSSILRSGSDKDVARVSFAKVISQISEQLVSNDQKIQMHNKSDQTDPPIFHQHSKTTQQPKLRQLFSKTSCINHALGHQIKQRQIDLCKNGFYVRAYNGSKGSKNRMGQATPSPSKVSDQMKYMNITFNNNKIKNENNPKLKTKANVYS